MIENVYKQYLIELARQEDRPFRLPKNVMEKLDERNDKSFFYALVNLLKESKIKKKDLKRFFVVAGNHLKSSFSIQELVQEFENIFKEYDEYDDSKLVREIKQAFDFLNKEVIINEVSSLKYFTEGSPPKIIKYWKQGKVSGHVVLSMIDLEKIKSKSWAKIYCFNLLSNINTIRQEIGDNQSNVWFTLQHELLKFNKQLKLFQQQLKFNN